MACFYAPNGQTSNLYEELKSLYGERKAKEIWYKVRTPEFSNEFGNWESASKELKLYTKDSFEYNAARASYSKVSPFVDNNFEPKLMYLQDANSVKPFKTALDSFINDDKIKRSIDNNKKFGKLTLDENEPQAKLLNFLQSFGFEVNESENLIINLAAKSISLDTSSVEQVSKAMAEPLSEMLSYSDYFYDIEREVRKTDRFKKRVKELEEEYGDSTKRNLNRLATKEIFKELLESGFSEKLAEELNVSKSLLDRIKEFINNLINSLKGADYSKIKTQINTIVENTFKGNDFIRLTKKDGYKQVDFQTAFDENSIAKDIMTKIGTIPNITLTGSIAYSTQGTVYRKIETVVHDLDFVNGGYSQAEIDDLVKYYYPDSIKAYSFFDKYQVDTYLIPPAGFRITNIERRETGKIIGYTVVDNETNEKKGSYKLKFDISDTGKTINEDEDKEGEEAMLVDFFSNDESERGIIKYPFVGSDGNKYNVSLSKFEAPFEAKLRYSRFKDIWDYNRFIPFNEEDIKKGKLTQIKEGVPELFESNLELANTVYKILNIEEDIKITKDDKYTLLNDELDKILQMSNEELEKNESSEFYYKYKELANLIKNKLKNYPTKVYYKEIKSGVIGTYNEYFNRIIVSPNQNFNEKTRTLLHESIHALTRNTLAKSEFGDKNFYNLINSYREKVIKKIEKSKEFNNKIYSFDWSYETSDNDEFLAAVFTEPLFRDILKDIPSDKSKGKTLWDDILNLIRNLIGIEAKNTLLEDVINDTLNNLENFDTKKSSFDSNKQEAQQQYSQYLDTIFPDSKVKGIVYRGNTGIQTNQKSKELGIFFTDDKNAANIYTVKYTEDEFDDGNIRNVIKKHGLNPSIEQIKKEIAYYKDMGASDEQIEREAEKIKKNIENNKGVVQHAVINIKNPKNLTVKDWFDNYENSTSLKENADGLLLKGGKQSNNRTYDVGENQIVVFEPEQIHILGSEQDIKGFKNFVEDQPQKFGKLTSESLNTPEVAYSLKATDILLSDKANEVFKKGEKNNWTLDKILTELQIPKEQKKLILDLEFNNYVDELSLQENIAMELVNRYTYTVEVNTSSTASPIKSGNVTFKLNDYMYIHNISFNKGFYKISFEDWQNNTGKLIPINSQEFTNARNIFEENNEQQITKDYSNLTAPGGIDYKINTFRTPSINNVISQDGEYHDNEFNRSRGDMIGWFRNDDKDSNKQVRRILELQSFFQKVKDKEIIVTNNKINSNGKFVIDLNDYKETVKIDDPLFDESLALEYITYVKDRPFEHNHGVLYEDDTNYYQQPDWDDDFLVIIPKDTLYNYKKDSQNNFLQLLNKNNNWVTFFLKSILQDSAKKGYKKVLFPTGETIIVIEQFKEIFYKMNEFNKVEKFLIDLKVTDFIKDVSGQAQYIGNDQEGYVDYQRVLESFYPNDAIENDETFDKARQQDLYRLKKDKSHYDNTEKQIQGTINFYENTVTNILKKQGYNPVVITDEHGNTWNEVEITPERDLSTIKFGKLTPNEFDNGISGLVDQSLYYLNDFENISIEELNTHIDKEINNDKITLKEAEENIKIIKDTYNDGYDKIQILEQAYDYISNVERTIENLEDSKVLLTNLQNYDEDPEVINNLFDLLKTGILEFANNGIVNNLNLVKAILAEDVKKGKLTQTESVEDLTKRVNESNLPEVTKTDLKELLKTEDNFSIQKVRDFIDDEEDELPRESLVFKDEVSGNTEPFFIATNKVKKVDKVNPVEISKAKAAGYDVVMSDTETHVLNPDVVKIPLINKPIKLNNSPIEFALNVMNDISSKSKVQFKKDYNLNKEWSLNNGILSYNPSMITGDTKVVPLITLASGLLRNNNMLGTMMENYGNKDIIDNYKFIKSKTKLDSIDYENIAFEHLNQIQNVKNKNLLLFLDPIVSQALANADKRSLDILSTATDFNNENVIKFGKVTKEAGEMEKKVLNRASKVKFDSSPDGKTIHAELTQRKHDYIKENGLNFDHSITGIVRQHNLLDFDDENLIKYIIQSNKRSKDWFDSLTELAKKDFITAVLNNRFNFYREENETDNFTFQDAFGNLVQEEPFDKELFYKLTKVLYNSEVRREVGTEVHSLIEKILKKDPIDVNNDIKKLEKDINNLETKIGKDNLLPRFNDRPKVKKQDAIVLSEDQKKLDRLYASLDFYNKIVSMKNQIEERGGRILTEVLVHTDKMLDINDGSRQVSVAGQIDMLVIYEDDESVDPEYRGKVEIYDFKTMHYEPKPAAPYYEIVRDFTFGLNSKKQAGYSLQLMLYQRILEEELGFEVKDLFLIPITVPEVGLNSYENDKGEIVNEVYIDGHFEISEVNDYKINEQPSGKITIEASLDENGKIKKTYSINIKTFYNTPFGNQGALVYNKAKRIAFERMRSKYNPKFGDEKVKKEKEDFANVDLLLDNKQQRINKLIDDIKIYLEKRLTDINRSIDKDPKKQDKQKTEINKLKTDISDLDKIRSLNTFIHASYLELYGTENMLGLNDKFELVINSYNQGDIGSSEAIRDIEDIRRIAENYNILDEIMNALLEGTSDKDLNEIKKMDSFKELETAIEIKKKLLDVRYQYEMERLLGNNLEMYLNENLNKSVDDFIKGKQIQYEQKIKDLEKKIKENPSNDKFKTQLKYYKDRYKKNMERFKDTLVRDAGTLVRDFKQLNRDIGFIERFLTAPISTSSGILSSYAMMLKFHLTEAEWNMKDIALEIQQAAKKLSSAVFDQSAFNFLPNQGDNPQKFYDPILETVKEWVRDPVTGKLILAETVNLVSEYGRKKFTYVNDDGKTVEDEMTYTNIIKHYQYRMRKLKEAGKFDEFRKVDKEYKAWVNKNMERPNIDDYYKMDDLFTKDEIGIKAKAERDRIISMMDNIKDRVKHRSIELSDDDLAALRELDIEYKLLGSIYDKDGIKKEDDDLKIAIRIQEFNTEYNKRHRFVVNYERFEDERRRAKLKFETEPDKYLLWLEENTEVKIDDSLFDKVKYLRKLKKVLKYAKNNDDYDLMDEIKLLSDEVINFKTFTNKIDSWFEEYELNNTKNDEYEINEEINDLLKPYRLGGTHVDTKVIPNDVIARLKELEEELNELFLLNKVTREQRQEDPSWNLFFQIKNGIDEAIDQIVEYVPNSEYYKRYELEQAKAESNGILFEESEWYINNHVEYTKEGEIIYSPIRAWMTTVPTYKTNKISERYKIDRKNELEKIKQIYPNYNDKALNAELEKTEWFLKNHKEDKEIKKESGYLLIDETLTEGVKLLPNYLYKSPEIKEEYIRTDLDKVTDQLGYMLPKKHLWVNSKYEQLDPKWKEFYNVIMKKYKEAQAEMPAAYRLGNRLPYIYKSGREELIEGKFKQRVGSWWQTKFGNKATREIENDNIMRHLSTSGEDIDLDEDQLIEGTATYSTSLENRSLPFRHVYHIDIENVSRDVVSSILSYIQQAERFKAKSEILPQMRAILNLINKRDKSTEGGAIERDAQGNKMIDAVAKKLGIEKFVRKEGETYEGALLRSFTEMQFFDDQNNEINYNIPVVGPVRVDKLLDGLMTAASYAQIGGITSTGWIKGFANYLQANTQIFLEGWAADHYNLKDWGYAKKLVYYGSNKIGSLTMDMVKDFGKISRETLSGQLFDMYDALQGTFQDEYGNDLTASKLNLALRSSTWFINNNIGEIEAAATSMYALLNSYKVINGEVYSIEDYMQKKTNDKGSELTYDEKKKAKVEFNKIKDTLLTSMELDADGKVIAKGIKDIDGVPFLRSKKNMQIRAKLHGINKDLQGNYATFDKTHIQRNVFGRLLMMYRKFLVPMARRRWGKLYRNEEVGVIRQGYYITFFSYLFTDWKKLSTMFMNSFRGTKQDTGLQPFEEANVRRATMELGIYLLLGLLVAVLAIGDDEDDEDVSAFRALALYELTRLRKEIGSLAPVPSFFGDNWKLFKSPTAFNGTVDRAYSFLSQVADPFAVYEKEQGIFKKGDSKLYAKGLKLFGNITSATNLDEMTKNLNRTF